MGLKPTLRAANPNRRDEPYPHLQRKRDCDDDQVRG